MKYIHYGHKAFSLNDFIDVSNEEYRNKPKGGLWASPIDSKYGWKQWCEDEQFRECNDENSFIFELKPEAKIYQINCKEDILKLQKIEYAMMRSNIYPDFEQIKESGIDAIQFNLSNDNEGTFDDSMYFALYGWDCDSLLVLNKHIIKTV